MISIGHDEYWDVRQYHNVKQAINDGLSVLWLSANDVYMVTPFTPNAKGEPNRRLTRETCYGELREEEKEAYSKVLGPFEKPGPDERDIIGARTIVPFNGGGDWTCAKPEHWLFEGTGMKKGDSQLLGVTSYAAPLLSTLALVLAGKAEPSLRLLAAAVLITGGAALAARASLAASKPLKDG